MTLNMWKKYHTPLKVSEVHELLQYYGDKARIIAGGTDLFLDLSEKRIEPVEVLVDVTYIPDFQSIEINGGKVYIGAGVTLAQILRSSYLKQVVPSLHKAVHMIASRQIRNIATLVGNLVNASPAADGAPPLYTYNAADNPLR
jgi:CO/xanthine dehydrogenase FAD-binding subunit